MRQRLLILIFSIFAVIPALKSEAGQKELEKIGHIVVIYMENRSFDHMMYGFPGADTASGASFAKQSDGTGKIFDKLPLPLVKGVAMPPSVENGPFNLDSFYPRGETLPNPIHRFYQNQFQINGGKNDRFVFYSGERAKALAMGRHDNERSALWRYAKEYALCDRFFMAAFGGSFLNHQWLISAASPVAGKEHAKYKAANVEDPARFKDGQVTPDGYAVNTFLPEWFAPYEGEDSPVLPPQKAPTIGDRLTEKSISWKWYSQGWKMALKSLREAWADPKVRFTPHHVPFIYYESCNYKSDCFKKNLADRDDLIRDIRENNLPQVVFYKPGDALDQHPGTGTVDDGDNEIDAIITEIKAGKAWGDTVVIVTYDENGGFWDHAPPPAGDKWGPGSRVPAVVVSPLAKKGFIDHTIYDTTSILKLIEKRHDLKPLGGERKMAGDLLNTLDLSR